MRSRLPGPLCLTLSIAQLARVLILVAIAACEEEPSRDHPAASRAAQSITTAGEDSLQSAIKDRIGQRLSPDELLRQARPLTAEEAEGLGSEPDSSIHLEHPDGWRDTTNRLPAPRR
jgi:hypothetical protein